MKKNICTAYNNDIAFCCMPAYARKPKWYKIKMMVSLKAAIQATATPALETDEDIQEKPTHQPKPHISDSVSNKAGTVTINIDADVTLPGEGTITIARLERLGADYFTQEYSTKIIETFFATDMASLTFYDPYVITKAVYEDTIFDASKKNDR